jgi:hypothetical protein
MAKRMRTAKKAARWKESQHSDNSEIELLPHFVTSEDDLANLRREEVQENIRPTAERIFWRQLPSLEAITLVEEMQRFPEVIHWLLAVGSARNWAQPLAPDLRRNR